MPGQARLGNVGAALLLLLAGCASSNASDTQDSPPSASVQAPGDEVPDAGSIDGVVVDDQNAPVEGVLIGLKESPVQALTDPAGAFAIQNLAPGRYTVFASKFGYETKAKAADVAANAATSIVFTIIPFAIAEPYADAQIKSIEITLGFGWGIGGDSGQGCIAAGVSCNSAAYPGANTLFKAADPENNKLATIVLEATWVPNSAVCAKTLRLRMYCPGANTGNPVPTNFGHWTNDPHPRWTITNPVTMVIPRADDGTDDAIDSPRRMELNGGDELTVKGNWTARTFPPGRGLTNTPVDFNCFTQQKIDLYFTAFYGDPAPTGYTLRPDA